MQKEVKKYGNSVVIGLTPEDLKFQKIKVGDIIEFTITKITRTDKN